MTPIARDLLCGTLVLGAVAIGLRGARPAATLGRAGPARACPVALELVGQGVTCLPTGEAHRLRQRAGTRLQIEGASVRAVGRMAPERLAALGVPVDVNRADAEELASLDGVGAKLAARLIAARPFRTVEEVAQVPGIGRRRLEKLRARLVLDEP
jgi:competence ComEA-like helix-hairpin-helix protein